MSGEWEDAMTEWLSSMGPAVANHLWQSTAFAVVAGLLTLALRKNQARARYWVWMAASMKFLLPFALLAAIGSHLARPRAVPAPAQQTMYFAMEDFSEPFVEMQGAGIRERGTEDSSPLSVPGSLKERAWCGVVAVVILGGWICNDFGGLGGEVAAGGANGAGGLGGAGRSRSGHAAAA